MGVTRYARDIHYGHYCTVRGPKHHVSQRRRRGFCPRRSRESFVRTTVVAGRRRPVVVSASSHFVVFRLDQLRYALPLGDVERVLRAVEVTPLPHAPQVVLGAVNIHGRVLPVLNVRQRFLLPDRGITPRNGFLLARTATRTVVLVVDEVEGIVECPEADIVAGAVVQSGRDFPGVIRRADGLVLIHDIHQFLDDGEERALNEAMHEAPGT